MALNIATISQCADRNVYEDFTHRLQAEFLVEDTMQVSEEEFDRESFERLRGQIGRR